MDNKEYMCIVEYLREIMVDAYQNIMTVGVQSASHKADNDLVIDTDLKLDEYFSIKLAERYPDYNLLTEESCKDMLLNGHTFVVDPLDGTCNFASNLKLSGIQVALFHEDICKMAAIFLPYRDEYYHAILGEGAYCNGKRIIVNRDIIHHDGILTLSDFYSTNAIPMEKQFGIVYGLQKQFLKTRLFGAACVDFTNLIMNRCQAYICYYFHIWDIAPGLLLAQEAGLITCTADGAEYKYGDTCLLVANNHETMSLLTEVFQKSL